MTGVDDGTNELASTYDAGGRRISENLNGTLTDASGVLLNTYDYTAYGDLFAQTGTTTTNSMLRLMR